jgi:hypothetical protein
MVEDNTRDQRKVLDQPGWPRKVFIALAGQE